MVATTQSLEMATQIKDRINENFIKDSNFIDGNEIEDSCNDYDINKSDIGFCTSNE